MRPAFGNLFTDARAPDGERIDTLLARTGTRIERIVSAGQASPEGFWYDQDTDEFVVLLRGAARLRFQHEPAARELRAGDWVMIPAHARHRVEATSVAPAAVWLAVHVAP